jgi:hypothetical protein
MLAFSSTVVLLVGCDLFSGSEPGGKDVQIIEDPNSFDLAEIRKDSFVVDSAFIDGDLLRLRVSYRGGCKEHDFTLYSTGPATETYPPSTETYLSHDARADTCRESLQEELTFDLSPLKERFDLSGALLIGIHTHEGGHPAHRSWYPPEYRP